MLYPLYKINFSYIDKLTDKAITSVFLFLTIIIFQSLVISGDLSGKIGDTIVSILSVFIGVAGLWLFVIIGFMVSIFIFFEDFKFKNFKLNLKLFSLKDIMPKPKPKKQLLRKLDKSVIIDKEENISINEIGDTAQIILTPTLDDQESLPNNTNNTEEPKIVDIQPLQTTQGEMIEDETTNTSSVIVDELEENKKLLQDLEKGQIDKPKDFILPKIEFFDKPKKVTKSKINEAVIDQKIEDLLEKLAQFKINGDVVRTYSGPIVTTFEFKPAPNVKVSKILNLQDDLAMALKATTIRIQAPIPGKDVVGIEVPNEDTQTIYMREILESELFQNSKSPLTIILGKDIVGKPFVTDLKKLPHLLIAGTTGSGKSVGINAMILSLLYKNSPDNLKMIMIDPKMLEFSMYNDIPHLLTPVITKPTEAINALASMVTEMEKRYTMMASTRTKNIENRQLYLSHFHYSKEHEHELIHSYQEG